jgi:enoyl-CoA hydratase/carnithine racemase
MAYENFVVEKGDGVAVLTINRPPANALSMGTLEELEKILTELEGDGSVRVIVLTGSGEKYFSAGADVGEFGMFDPKDQVLRGHAITRRVEKYSKPVIVAINGFCLGGGNELAMSAHLRFAAEHAQFGQPEVLRGIICGWGGTQRLPRLIGRTRALEYLLTGDRFSAADAERFGLVNRVLPKERLMEETLTFAKKLAKGAPLAMSATLATVDEGLANGFEAGSQLEIEKEVWLGQTEDAGIGVAAFLTKTEAVFKGQ